MAPPATALDKIWALHAIAELSDGRTLLYIDRHLTHDVTSPRAYADLERSDRTVRRPDLTLAVEDHILSTDPGRDHETHRPGAPFVIAQRRAASKFGVPLIDVRHPHQGIVHVIASELGVALPGTTIVCGDSHTCTLGGVGALSFGIGTGDVEHVLATQVLAAHKPRSMRVRFEGRLGRDVTAKDMVLHLIGQVGVRAGVGHAIEFAGPAIRELGIEGRHTICNMAVEMGARIGFVAADAITFDYLRGRTCVPAGADWDRALAHWSGLATDRDAVFDREVVVQCDTIEPQVTWGITPQHTIGITAPVPDPALIADASERSVAIRALAYMDVAPGESLIGMPIQNVFIGSCNSSRLGDLRAAARVVDGRRVARGMRALVVPGSTPVRRAAEAEGLDRIFLAAGFEWRESACSMCAAVNGDKVPEGERCVATSNRNFEGRQGRNARTHLASPAMAAAAAIAGAIVDVREMRPGGL